jgi:hypothetical protein
MEAHESVGHGQTKRTVHCERHGDNREAFMCKHLLLNSGSGFVADPPEPENPYPDAWCSGCEQTRIESGGEFSDDYARSVIKLVCGDCYSEIKARHMADAGSAD